MSSPSLEQAMISLQAGNLEAFEIIYEKSYKSIFYVIFGIVKDYALAEDVSQNVYLRIVEKIHLYKAGTNPLAWMITIAKNQAFNELRKNKKEVIVDIETLDNLQNIDNKDNLDTPLIDLAKKI